MDWLISIMTKLSRVPNDKLLHFFYGAIIGFPLVFFLGVWGMTIAIIFAGAKEIILDWLIEGKKPDFLDFVFSAIPPTILYLMKFAFWL